MGHSLSSHVRVTNKSVGRTSKCCLMMDDWCGHILSLQGLGCCGLLEERKNMWFPLLKWVGCDFL